MYKLEKLPYSYEELEPYIDTHTLGLHYNKHYKNYLKKLNELLNKNDYDFRYSLEDLPKHIIEFNENDREDILFNLGGVINHNIYFNSMSPNKETPSVFMNSLIINSFESYESFLKEFKQKALALKGSGYTYLILDNGVLRIINLFNQDNPYNYNIIPLIALDMWEHAYYINYQNKKDIYIDNFLEIMDFKNANNIIMK